MRNFINTLNARKTYVLLVALMTNLLVFFIGNTDVKAQNNKSKIEQTVKTTNNVSTWKSIIQSQKIIPSDTIKSYPKKQITASIIKETKDVNPENYFHPETGLIKLANSPESIEVIGKRDAQSRTFLNTDGSFTKVQTNGYLHYKDASGNWISFDGTLTQNQKNTNLYEVTQTDLPIFIDLSNGKTIMTLEKGQSISFGNNVELKIMDKNFNEIKNVSDNKSKNSSVKEKEILTKNIWNDIDRQQQVDYWYAKTDYILNTKPDFNSADGYLVFEDKIELPEGWQIIKSDEGEETATGWQGDLIIINSSGNEVGRFHTPIYYENSTNSSTEKENCTAGKKISGIQNSDKSTENDRAIIGAYRIKETDGKYTISVVVPLSWLLSADRTYPVTIDPTASNTYASGNISSCYYPTFNSVNMNVTVPAGSTVTATNSACTYVAVSPSWRSDGWIGFQSGSNLDGYWYCNVNSPGTCNVTGTSNSTIANGTYPSGTVPFTLKVSRDYPSGSCNTTYLYVSNSTWTETVTYTTPCTAPGAPTLASPANNANIQPGKTTHFTWNAPTTGTTPFTYTFYFYNGSSWQNWSAGSNTYFDLQLSEYNSSSWCGTNAQWYVKATNSCGNTNSATRNIIPYPKYSGSTADYTITPNSNCQTTGAHSIVQGGADYYSFNATAGNTYYFSTCSSDLGCGTSTGWDTYLKIYGTDGSCTSSAYIDDGSTCSNYESFINGWTCGTTGTYYIQITGYNSSAYGTYYLQYKSCSSPSAPTLALPANNANVQPGKVTHFTWNAPSSGTGPFYYRFYFYNGSSWSNWACDTNRYIDLQLLEYNSASWCGVSAQWYVKDSNSCGTNTSATRNLIPYPKYAGSTADYTITPTSNCQTSGAHSIIQGGADYYSFNATAGNTYYFSTCGSDLGCGTNTGWDTYLKIYGIDGSCTTSVYIDDGSSCSNYESFINGWTCSSTGTYYLQLTGYNSSAYGTYYLQYKLACPTVTADLTGGSSPICYNTAPAMFSATGSGGNGSFTYLWYLNGSTTGITTQTYTAPALTANATVYCAVSSCGQTINTLTYNITVNPLPNAEAGTNDTICNGDTTQLNASGGTGYSWSPETGLSETNISNPYAYPSNTTKYYVTVTNNYGCTAIDSVIVTVNPKPTAEAGNDVSICYGSIDTLTALGGITYLWSTSDTTASIIVSPDTTTSYVVTVTNDNGCTASAGVKVTVMGLPNAEAGTNDTICNGDMTQLNASGGTTYLWSPGTGLSATNVSNPTATPTNTTTYTVTVTDENGCSAIDNVMITVNPLPIATITSTGLTTTCTENYQATLTSSPANTYYWNTGATTQSIIVSTKGIYIVTVTDNNGCSSTSEPIIVVR